MSGSLLFRCASPFSRHSTERHSTKSTRSGDEAAAVIFRQYSVNADRRRLHQRERSRARGPKSRHLGALIVILQRSIADHDFLRAEKAWAMLIRSETGGLVFDIRSGHRWSLGAECMLRNLDKQDDRAGQGIVHQIPSEPHEKLGEFRQNRFAAAREYYARLILQFPHRRMQPSAVDSVDFHAAMFSLWIYAVSQQMNAIVSESKEDTIDSLELQDLGQIAYPADARSIPQSSGPASDGMAPHSVHSLDSRDVDNIADMLDKILASPPFSDHPWFLHLRAEIASWLLDVQKRATLLHDVEAGVFSKELDSMTPDDWRQVKLAKNLSASEQRVRDTLLSAQSARLRATGNPQSEYSIILKRSPHRE